MSFKKKVLFLSQLPDVTVFVPPVSKTFIMCALNHWSWNCIYSNGFHCTHLLAFFSVPVSLYSRGAWIAQWLERRIRDRKVGCSSPGNSGGRIFFSRLNFPCWLLFRYPLPRVTAVARNKSRLFCQKCRWLVTAKHVCTIRTWLCMKWRDMVHVCMVYTERAETAAVSSGTSHVRTKQCCNYTTWVDIQSAL